MKRTLSIILSVLMLCSVFTNLGITASAADTTASQSGSGVTYTLDQAAGTLVISGTGPMTDYAYAFGTPWAYKKSYVKTITIEEGVTHIGNYAFSSFPNLTSVTIPSTVTSIGNYAFDYCTSLPSIEIPDTVTTIGTNSFSNCTKATTLTVGNGVTAIPANAFYNSNGLTTVTLGNSVKEIGKSAFYNCKSLASISLSESLKTIGNNAFEGCIALTSIAFPTSLETIGNNAFMNCSGFTSHTIPAGVTSIGDMAFRNNSAVTSFTVNSNNPSYCSVNGVLFDKDCKTLIQYPLARTSTSYTIPSTVETVGSYAFFMNKSLKTITISSSVSSLGDYAFYYCSGLTSLTIPGNVKTVGSNAFYNCAALSSLTISNGTETIGYNAFAFCSKLTSISLPDSLTDINASAFNNTGCYNNTANWTSNVLYIGKHLIKANTSVSGTHTVKSGTVSIANAAFTSCTNLTGITMPASVTNIGSSIFEGCTKLANVELSNNITEIPSNAFYNCSKLTSITIPQNVATVGYSAFEGCTGLKSITIPNAVTYIDQYAFNSCSALTAVHTDSIENWLNIFFKNYSANPLYYAKNLYVNNKLITTLTVPESFTTVNAYAFINSTSLTTVEVPETVTSIGQSAFEACTGLEKITILNGECEIYDSSTTISDTAVIYGYSGSTANAYATTYGRSFVAIDYEYKLNSDGTATITAYHGKNADEVIPDVIDGYTVTALGDYAFSNCTTLASVTIPDAVATIGSYAFSGCTNLSSITISDTVTSIGNGAFSNCADNFVMYGSAGSAAETYAENNNVKFIPIAGPVGENAVFSYNAKSNTLVITGTGDMYDYSQTLKAPWNSYVDDIEMVLVEAGITSIGNNAFYNCSNLTLVEIADSVKTIGDYAFYHCANLSSIFIPDGITTVGKNAFGNCVSLASIATGNSITTYEEAVFYGCTNLTSVFINNLEAWCNATFITPTSTPLYYAKNLYVNGELVTKLTIPENVTSISDYAFWNCSSITSVTIPETITEIGKYAFYKCNNIQAVYISSLENWCNITFDNYYANPLYYAGNLFIKGEAVTTLTIPENVTAINDYAFINCDLITDVTIPDSVISIGQDAFYGCIYLMNVNADSIESWCNISFENSTANPLYYSNALYINGEILSELEIPATVTAINNYTFFHCTALTSVTIPNTVTSIGDYAFHNCTATVYGYTDTAAEEYAISNGLTFVAYGDVNGDGEVSINDVTTIQKHLAKITQLNNSQLAKADVNGDGKLSIRDATYIQMYIAKIIDTFPTTM